MKQRTRGKFNIGLGITVLVNCGVVILTVSRCSLAIGIWIAVGAVTVTAGFLDLSR